nr:MAG TPA: hypothetical protein [Caudoviricetes sp.]
MQKLLVQYAQHILLWRMLIGLKRAMLMRKLVRFLNKVDMD